MGWHNLAPVDLTRQQMEQRWFPVAVESAAILLDSVFVVITAKGNLKRLLDTTKVLQPDEIMILTSMAPTSEPSDS